ncbi:MAG TPA: NADH-quinone oxidoreductase subunit J [Egibacteraceae bacterium]|nr:NADH-quinone oxidoreductase subunit J [Actinomycetota bacterium]HWB72321.1 NADH-quinone oxidoreductase subunit J [Egibacteraceae bacterium]
MGHLAGLLAQAPPVPQGVEQAASGTPEFWAFWVLAPVALGSAVAMVLMRNAVHAALMLVLNFFTIAVLYAVLEAQFLATVQIIVYAGAIMVLFLFVIMLLGVAREQPFVERLPGQKPAAVLLGLALLAALAFGVAGPYMGPESACNVPAPAGQEAAGVPCAGLGEANAGDHVGAVGALLFTDFVWPFEVTSVLLVIAAVGALVLGRRHEDPADLVDRLPEPVEAGAAQERRS